MKITLFGGSFNPPHFGHLIVAQQAFELIPDIDQLWLLPAFKHTFQKDLADSSHRIKMAQTLIMQLPREVQEKIQLNTIECQLRLPGETYLTYQILKENYHAHEFSFLMGSDQLPTFNKWGHYQELLDSMHFYIYPRANQHHPVTYPNMTLLESPDQVITNISSTLIRERLEQNLPIHHLVPSAILNYIINEKIYI